ncbi:MAG: hypothetical protein ACYTGB_03885 [Planctomycetota bacterium]|jgi:chemotaxis receptor (MCP) glutamine deamidase CheD
MGCGKSLSRHVLAPGETVVADDSAVLELTLDGSLAIILYDRRSRLAAACFVGEEGSDRESLRDRMDSHGLKLLHEMIVRGSAPDSIEMFAFGPGPAPEGGAGRERAHDGPICARPALVHSDGHGAVVRRVEFDVRSGRMLIEESGAPPSAGRPGGGES